MVGKDPKKNYRNSDFSVHKWRFFKIEPHLLILLTVAASSRFKEWYTLQKPEVLTTWPFAGNIWFDSGVRSLVWSSGYLWEEELGDLATYLFYKERQLKTRKLFFFLLHLMLEKSKATLQGKGIENEVIGNPHHSILMRRLLVFIIIIITSKI